jgi:hypothetical protein
MAVYSLDKNFRVFLRAINPPPTYEQIAASEHRNVTGLLESASGPASVLSPGCFLQGSYRQETAIHTINDVDIVALCDLYYPGSAGAGGRSYPRDEIFDILAGALRQDHRYRGKIRYDAGSLCIKIDLAIKVEILPAVKPEGISDFNHEPFKMFRPERGTWADGYARLHQAHLSEKNRASPNFKPMIKTVKHLRDQWGIDVSEAVSFHIECLLYRVADQEFAGAFADAVENVLVTLARFTPSRAFLAGLTGFTSPCGDKVVFSESEWSNAAYKKFHGYATLWAALASQANRSHSYDAAVGTWKRLLGDAYFPRAVS